LGVRDIENFNIALLAKWKWRLSKEDHVVWREALESKYGSWKDHLPNSFLKNYVTLILHCEWRYIGAR